MFRIAFDVEEGKFRALIHVHDYHNESEIKEYWSSITNIPLKQFHKSYLKQNTKIRLRENYRGTISIRYQDALIALELRTVYNTFARTVVGGVVQR